MMKKITNDMELHRVRRTLTEVKNKLEEALRLSEQLQHEGRHDESTAANHRR